MNKISILNMREEKRRERCRSMIVNLLFKSSNNSSYHSFFAKRPKPLEVEIVVIDSNAARTTSIGLLQLKILVKYSAKVKLDNIKIGLLFNLGIGYSLGIFEFVVDNKVEDLLVIFLERFKSSQSDSYGEIYKR